MGTSAVRVNTPSSIHWMKGAGIALFLGVCPGAVARADGAFPDGLQIFAPPDAPHTILFATNFGLLRTDDDGATWRLVCELAATGTSASNAGQYQRGPDGALYTRFGSSVAASRDEGCTWTRTSVPGALVTDLFADPTVGGRVYAIARDGALAGDGHLLRSDDGAATFAELFEEDAGELESVESARSDADALYASGIVFEVDGGYLPRLLAGGDGGFTASVFADAPEAVLRIAAVDPTDARTLYLRRLEPGGDDALAISRDGARSAPVALELGEPMSAFARADDGTLYVGAQSGHLWRADPDGGAFVQLTGPRFRCLTSRGTALYACADDALDGYALGLSLDRGVTFTPLLRFQDVAGLAICAPVQAACADAWKSFTATFGIAVDPAQPTQRAPATQGCSCGGRDPPLGALGILVLAAASRKRRARLESLGLPPEGVGKPEEKMSHKKGSSTLIALKVPRELAQILESLPNKSEFIRSAVEAQLGNVCPLCRGTGLAPLNTKDELAKLVEQHPNVRCESCGALEPRPCHPADADAHHGECEDTRVHNFEAFGTYFCERCFGQTATCTTCGRHFVGERGRKTCDACRAESPREKRR